MNIILFEDHETGKPLPRRDPRTLHLLKVLHKKAGDTFEAGILGGLLGQGRIEALEPDGSLCFSLNLQEPPPPRVPVRLAVGFPRPIQLRRLLRDLSNLGIEAIDLLETELGEKSYRNTTLLSDGGARAALVEGAVQARDTALPILSVYPGLKTWLAGRPWAKATGNAPDPMLAAADNVRPQGALARLPLSPASGAFVLAVGPERGWSDRERDLFQEAGFVRLSLGSRALRTETACTAAVIMAMEKLGKLG